MQNYDTALTDLAKARACIEQFKAEMNAMVKVVSDSPNYIEAQRAYEESKAVAAQIEEEIRKSALEGYTATGEKNPHEKVTVKVFKVFSVIDPARVLAWVKNNLADALVVDGKKVESYATKIGPVDGTALTEEPRAQIATKL